MQFQEIGEDKMINKYRKVKSVTEPVTEQVGFLLNKVVYFLEKIIAAIQKEDLDDKYIYVDRSIVVLTSIADLFKESEKQEIIDLKEEWNNYINNGVLLINQISATNNIDLAKIVLKSLKEMSEIWYQFGKTKNIEQAVKPESEKLDQENKGLAN